MLRPTSRRNLPFAIVLLAELACTGNNPLFGVGTLDAADGPRTDAGTDSNLPDASAETALPDAPAPTMDAPSGTLGTTCTTPGACQSGFCVDGVCCDSACRERCRSCGLSGTPGTCTLIPAGMDPRLECPTQDPSTCGRAGGCDGTGDCLLHSTGTECRARTCSAGVEIGAGICNGTGSCNPGMPTACTLGECSGDRCAVGCTTMSCPTGFQCQAGKCTGGGPVLHWRFDETTGTTAADSSPSGFTGFYRGSGALPTPSTSVPPTTFTNPRSLAFGASGLPGVQLSPVTAALRPATVTVSLWYRATTVPSNGSDLLNLGDDYILRMKPAEIEFAKRRSDVEGMFYQLATATQLTGHLDGNWHHLTGVISATSVNLYYDGNLRVSRPSSEPLLYRGVPELWVARDSHSFHGFQGNLDDLRIYPRDLSLAEIQQLAARAP
jgi:hypothetical protein